MAKVAVYNQNARARIRRSVQYTESVRPTRLAPRGNRRGIPNQETFAIAGQDIEHDQFGTVNLATAPSMGSSSYTTYSSDLIRVFNPGVKVWSGSRVILQRVVLAGAPDTECAKWYIRQAWSATRIRGVSQSSVAPGTTAALGQLNPIDGHFGPTLLDFFLPTTYVTIEASGLAVWVELVYRIATKSSRWEVYSADCIEAGP